VRPAALLFDFNGTLSDDERIQCEIYQEIFAESGKPLGQVEYFERLAGLSDPEIVRTWLGVERPELVAERVSRYQVRAADGSTVGPVEGTVTVDRLEAADEIVGAVDVELVQRLLG
jgi:beta-phosphoglucomutase-like phosphatase (HAD superfamily)